MNYCENHPNKEALSVCHVCGKYYCESCLDEGDEYYYCKNPECHQELEKELGKFNIPANIVCPNCNTELVLSNEERMKDSIHCPECDAAIDLKSNPPKILEDEDYKEIMRSLNQGDIGIIKSILEDGNIDYFVLGENFLGVRPLLEPVRIFVNVKQVKETEELLKDFDPKIFGFSSRQDEDYE